MSYKINEDIIAYTAQNSICTHKLDVYLKEYRNFLMNGFAKEVNKEICSGYNRMKRGKFWCCEGIDLSIEIGDIVYMEFGQAFLNEAGFQHFGLIISLWNKKAFVVPMTSNMQSSKHAVNVNKHGRSHLYYIGYVNGLSNHSTLFLNDAKMINTSRIISVNGNISPNSEMFKEIQEHLVKGLFSEM